MRKSSGTRESHRRSGILHFRGLSDEKIFGGPESLIAAAGFYISERLGDEKIFRGPENLIAAARFYISERLGDEKIFRGPENLIATARFYNSRELSDEKNPPRPLRISSSQWNFTIPEH